MMLDPRVNATRGDIAAVSLRGKVEAKRFADGVRYSVITELTDVKRQPRHDASLETQLLHGETVTVYAEEDGWGWGQAARDDYVGYIAMSALAPLGPRPTHRVIVNRTFVYPAADMKRAVLAALPMDGRVVVEAAVGAFFKIGGYGFVFAAHFAPIDEFVDDYVTVAERLIGVPYLWGGKSPIGIDCSGLVSLACSLAGRAMPRDTDMQEQTGDPLPVDAQLDRLTRGDLVFWKSHVGIICDPGVLLHANAHHMMVAREPLLPACLRILSANGTTMSSCRRLQRVVTGYT